MFNSGILNFAGMPVHFDRATPAAPIYSNSLPAAFQHIHRNKSTRMLALFLKEPQNLILNPRFHCSPSPHLSFMGLGPIPNLSPWNRAA